MLSANRKVQVTRLAHSITGRVLATRWGRQQGFNLLSLLTPTSEAQVGNARFLFSTSDRVIGRHLYSRGAWEQSVMAQAVRVLTKLDPSLGTKDRVFVDVGANIGTASITALREHGARKAVAIEADPAVARYLRANATINDLDERVAVVQLAASASQGSVSFRSGTSNWGAGEVVSPGDGSASGVSVFEVATKPLDQILSDEGVDPSEIGLVWIDAQAHERLVLEGSTAVIANRVPLVVEFWPVGLRSAGEYDRFVNHLLATFTTIVHLRRTVTREDETLSTAVDFDHLAAELGSGDTDLLLWNSDQNGPVTLPPD